MLVLTFRFKEKVTHIYSLLLIHYSEKENHKSIHRELKLYLLMIKLINLLLKSMIIKIEVNICKNQ